MMHFTIGHWFFRKVKIMLIQRLIHPPKMLYLKKAYYNWAIAISGRVKLHGRTKEAEELWKQPTKDYDN
ncbi:hypothetical protein L1887_10230 [Cichorium endivia]|nr:hypothetical protein L1887_10230 [Cichorium endivia]